MTELFHRFELWIENYKIASVRINNLTLTLTCNFNFQHSFRPCLFPLTDSVFIV